MRTMCILPVYLWGYWTLLTLITLVYHVCQLPRCQERLPRACGPGAPDQITVDNRTEYIT